MPWVCKKCNRMNNDSYEECRGCKTKKGYDCESKGSYGDNGVFMGEMTIHTNKFSIEEEAVITGNVNVYQESDIKYCLVCNYSKNGHGHIEAVSVTGPSIVCIDHENLFIKSASTSNVFGSFKWNSSTFSRGSPINIGINDGDSLEIYCKNEYFTVNGADATGKTVIIREGDIFSPAPNLVIKFELKGRPVFIEGTLSPVNPECEIDDSIVYHQNGSDKCRYYNGFSERLVGEYISMGMYSRRITDDINADENTNIATTILRVNNTPMPKKVIHKLKDE